MRLPDKSQDIFHWCVSGILGLISLIIDNGDDIVLFCAVVGAVLQVAIQILRLKKAAKKD